MTEPECENLHTTVVNIVTLFKGLEYIMCVLHMEILCGFLRSPRVINTITSPSAGKAAELRAVWSLPESGGS